MTEHNPYLAAAIAEQLEIREAEKAEPKTSGDTPAKAAKSAEKSDNTPSKES